MTSPCVNENHFALIDGELNVLPRGSSQLRRFAYDDRPGISKTYTANPGNPAAGDVVITLSGISGVVSLDTTQRLMAFVTLDSCLVEWRSRTKGFIEVYGGITTGTTPATPVKSLLCQFGGGFDIGPSSGNATFAQYTDRSAPMRMMLPELPTLVNGQRYQYHVEVRVMAENWDTSTVSGGTTETVNRVEIGDIRIDLFSSPLDIFFPPDV
ncbi:gp33 [Rhodococcus phage ReqiPine5]|uniref:Gp33 n=1 Tax=Rhodococcus phage ReqiPine5 TaxID=691963 RepID=D4P808_9CAUD|nr:gp33 [Rhodococcus phage ReqiPine5]ADD81138.1 gp33 [Rhodococcus phage ReqiPine5]